MIRGIARAVSSRRGKWVVIGVWVALLAVFAPFSVKLKDVTTDESATVDSLPADAQSSRVKETLDKRFPGGAAMLSLVVYRREGGLTAADRATISTAATAIREGAWHRHGSSRPSIRPPRPAWSPRTRPRRSSSRLWWPTTRTTARRR